MSIRNLPSSAFGIVFAVLLTACGKKTPEPPVPKAAAPAVARTVRHATTPAKPVVGNVAGGPAHASTAFRVGAVTLGSAVDAAHKITDPTTHFTPTEDTLYASVASTGSTHDTALNARWNYLQGTGQLISSVTQHLASDGPANTTFTLHNPDLWPEGKYNVEISVDGRLVRTEAFTIGK